MAKIRLRLLINKFPVLDGLRLSLLAWICQHGSAFFGNSYAVVKFVPKATSEYLNGDKPAIIALYHGRMVGLLSVISKRKQLSVLISESRDGEIIARALRALGFSITRGSQARGAVKGALQTIKAARTNLYPVITVDGPRGPQYDVKPGIIRMAELTNLPIIPFVCSARSYWTFWGWDRFHGPLWGTPEVFLYGEPIFVPAENDDQAREQLRSTLDERLSQLREKADAYWAAVAAV